MIVGLMSATISLEVTAREKMTAEVKMTMINYDDKLEIRGEKIKIEECALEDIILKESRYMSILKIKNQYALRYAESHIEKFLIMTFLVICGEADST